MSLAAVHLEDFEGLIFKTAVMLTPYVEEDFDDICQLLRIKAWKAYESYRPERSKLPLKRYVFGCLVNYTKDLRKRKKRGVLFIADLGHRDGGDGPGSDNSPFEARYLCVTAEEAFMAVEDEVPLLPNTLTDQERALIGVLLQEDDLSQAALGRRIGVGVKKVQALQQSIRTKMSDWEPSTPVRESELERQAA